ncbi:MAG: YARHG domain-containing protein [Lachnospiraceae bacterium]|nr:YARHG domain-containing protein [Lachnospiraceae bacterium]
MGIIQKKAETGNSTTSNEDLMEWMQNTFSDDKSSVKDEDDNNNENQYTDENNQENYENQENFNNDDIAQQYLLPDSNSRYLTKSDIRHLSKAELRLARNEIYARHGRKFADETLQAYFDSQDWYSGIISPDNFSEDVLNDYERKNAELISNYEVEMGYK